MRQAWALALAGLLPLAGCLGGDPSPAEAPAAAAVGSRSILDEPATPGWFVADDAGQLHREAGLPGWRMLEDGRLEFDVLDVVQRDRMDLHLVQALVPQRMHVGSHAAVQVESSLLGGEGEQNHGTCFETVVWGTNQGGFFIDRLRGLDPLVPRPMAKGFGHGTAHSETWLANFGGSYDHVEAKSLTLEAGEWVVIATGMSQVPAEDAAVGDNVWNVTLRPEGPYRVVSLPAVPLVCLFGLNGMPGVQVDALDVARGGNLTVESPYGVSVLFADPPTPLPAPLDLLFQGCPPVGDHRSRVVLNGVATEVGDGQRYSEWTFDRARATVEVEEWGCQSRRQLSVVGMPEPLIGVWWDHTRAPRGNETF